MRSLALALVSALVADAGLSVREVKEDPDPEKLADSKTIEGPDCGHVKQIIGKWQHAKKAGKLAGAARGAITNADAASEQVDKVITRARDIGKEINDGEVPSRVEGPAKYAEEASTKATDKSTELDTMLGAFKDKIGEGEFSAAKVSSDDFAKLKDKTTETNAAVKASYEAANRAMEKAKSAKEDALKDAGKALKIIKGVLKTSQGLIKDSKEIKQKSGFAIDEAEETTAKVSDIATKIDKKGDDSKEQKPVYTALKENLEGRSQSVDDGVTSLKKAITDMETTAGDLEGTADSMKKAAEEGDAGNSNAVSSEATEVPKAEGENDKLSADISTVKGRAKTVVERTDRLKDAIKKAKKKIG